MQVSIAYSPYVSNKRGFLISIIYSGFINKRLWYWLLNCKSMDLVRNSLALATRLSDTLADLPLSLHTSAIRSLQYNTYICLACYLYNPWLPTLHYLRLKAARQQLAHLYIISICLVYAEVWRQTSVLRCCHCWYCVWSVYALLMLRMYLLVALAARATACRRGT